MLWLRNCFENRNARCVSICACVYVCVCVRMRVFVDIGVRVSVCMRVICVSVCLSERVRAPITHLRKKLGVREW